MTHLYYSVTEEVGDRLRQDKTGLDILLDARPKFITDITGSDINEMRHNERQEAHRALQDIIYKEIANNPFYEFFASIEITENGAITRIVERDFRGQCDMDVTEEDVRAKDPKRPLPDLVLMGIYDILIPFLNSITIVGDAKVYAEIVSRKNFKARGIVEYHPYNGTYLYRVY